MGDIITLLPDHVANQIAAGEVVQRPASVVKELLENAIDAGSDHVQLIIKEAGKQLIQVVDNGKGKERGHGRDKGRSYAKFNARHTVVINVSYLPSFFALEPFNAT